MSDFPGLGSKLLDVYADSAPSGRLELSALRRLAALDQASATALDQGEYALDRWYFASQDWVLASNALFDLRFRMGQILRRNWYEDDRPYDASHEADLVSNLRSLIEISGELLDSIASLQARGRSIDGLEVYEENVRRARAIIEDHEIRKEAEALMPPISGLDAIANAHLRSIGH